MVMVQRRGGDEANEGMALAQRSTTTTHLSFSLARSSAQQQIPAYLPACLSALRLHILECHFAQLSLSC